MHVKQAFCSRTFIRAGFTCSNFWTTMLAAACVWCGSYSGPVLLLAGATGPIVGYSRSRL